MIIASSKPLQEIQAMIGGARQVLVVACWGCTAVCLAGGAAQAERLALSLSIAAKAKGIELLAATAGVLRQCEPDLLKDLSEACMNAEVVVSLACGVGVQELAAAYPLRHIVPGLNTSFAGSRARPEFWEERCAMCGDCVLHLTAGICPITRCAKGILNGPCGGAQDGRCEVNPETPCAWIEIYERLKAAGRLEWMIRGESARDWRTTRAGGTRRLSAEGV